MASPIPVLPLVGSIISTPGFRMPAASAASTMASAIRSFTQPAGLNDSSFTITFASRFLFDAKFESCNSGVLPISSFRFLAIFAINLFVCVRRSGNCPGLVYIFSLVDFFSIRKNDTIIYIAKIELDHSFHNRTDVVFLYPVYGMPSSVFFTNML